MSAQTLVAIEPIMLDREAAARVLAMSLSAFESAVAAGDAPKPRKLGKRRVAWLVSDLRAHAASLPESDILPPPDSGYGRAGKPA